MTPAYLLQWAGADSEKPRERTLTALLARHGLVERWRGRRTTLFGTDPLPLRALADGAGAIIGPLFDRSGRPAPVDLNVDAPALRARFIDQFWGSYVAFVETPDGLCILRDPSGGLACYQAAVESSRYLTSLPHLLVDCGLLKPEIDWEVIGEALTRHDQRRRSTALHGIDELLPGTLCEIDHDGSRERLIWEAGRFATRSSKADPVVTLERALDMTLGAWGSFARRPLVEISGGLDSSIVAAGVAASASDATLLTFAPAPGDPDETAYARAVADHLGLSLHIAHPDIADVDLTRSLSANLPRPNARAFTQAADIGSLERARAIDAGAFFSGGGGDDVFCYLRSVLPALDRLQAEGVRAMVSTAVDIARMNHATLWEAFVRILRRLKQGDPSQTALDRRFMDQDYLGRLPEPAATHRHPDLPPGKARHVDGVLTIHNYLEGHARAAFAPIISPLLSQPIVEACLAVPTWRWCENGRNRAVARKAFAGRLPDVVIERRSKGSFDAFCARLLDRNRDILLAMLAEGQLAARGFIDRQAITAALRNPSPPAAVVSRLLTLVDVESWISAWSTRVSHFD